jgi:hypothetical protein
MAGGASATILAVGLSGPATRPVKAASGCSCVAYVKAAWRLSGSVPGDGGAQNMAGQYLASQGFRRISAPAPWAIVVFSSKYPGMDSRYGHVALVARWTQTSGGWMLTIRGANQYANDGNVWTEQGCSNVSDWSLRNPVPFSSTYVSFWVR